MPASAPLSARPVAVTVMPLPTLAVAKVAVPLVPRLTSSVPTIPARERVRMVADVLPSFLLEAVTDGVNDFAFTVRVTWPLVTAGVQAPLTMQRYIDNHSLKLLPVISSNLNYRQNL